MIAYVSGVIEEVGTDYLVIDHNGMGYRILTPGSVVAGLEEGQNVKIYTYLHVREDAMLLFGFLQKSELDMFKLLISVSGIGPKGALGVLSVLDANDLKFAILAGDAKTISSAPGIGKKTAEKVVIELKDKVKLEDAFEEKLAQTEKKQEQKLSLVRQDAAEALVALGYSQSQALKAIRQVEDQENMDVEDLLKQALKNI